MEDNNILQEMIANHTKCRVIQDNDSTTVKVRPKVIQEELTDKLSQEDIQEACGFMSKVNKINDLKVELYRNNCTAHCKNSAKCFAAVPNGSIDTDILFINKMPTQYETARMLSNCDTAATFLSLILGRMNIKRDSIYFTDMIKCNTQLDEQSFNECINHFLVQEINLVQPKLIICNGLSVLKTCGKTGILDLSTLPSGPSYGNIYNVRTASGAEVKVTAIYDLDIVLSKSGDDYTKCKNELWSQILSAFKSIYS